MLCLTMNPSYQKGGKEGKWSYRRALQILFFATATISGLKSTIPRRFLPTITRGIHPPTHHTASITSISYEVDRIAYNKELQELLSKNLSANANTAVQQLHDQGFVLNVDTIHILISDAFSRKMPDTAEELYVQYFQNGTLSPTVRTLNILMEGFRNGRDDTKVDYYRSQFAHHNVEMDTYSYSTWVRQCKNAKNVREVVRMAIRNDSISTAFLRCAMESLGKLGDPQGALTVAGRLLYNRYPKSSTISPPIMSPNSSPVVEMVPSTVTSTTSMSTSSSSVIPKQPSRGVFRSASSGDSLMVALLENPLIKLLPADATELNWLTVSTSNTLDDSNSNADTTNSNNKVALSWHKDNDYDITTISELEQMLANQSCGEAAIALVLSGTDNVRGSENTRAVTKAEAEVGTTITIGQHTLDHRILSLGSKGWCRLFTFLQRSIRDVLTSSGEGEGDGNTIRRGNGNQGKYKKPRNEEAREGGDGGSLASNSQFITDDDDEDDDVTATLKLNQLRSYRDRLWMQLYSQIIADQRFEAGGEGEDEGEGDRSQSNGREEEEREKTISLLSSPSSSIASSSSSTVATISKSNTPSDYNDNNNIELNGRLCDSILRCYVDDPETARQLWKNSLLPLVKKSLFGPVDSNNKIQQDAANDSLQEVCEKSLEALMFICGAQSRADLGYEIAFTARKNTWSDSVRGKLGRAYVQGKIQWARTRKNSKTSSSYITSGALDLMLTDGLERSIESELGLQLKDFFPSSTGVGSGGKRSNSVGQSVPPGGKESSSMWPSKKAWKVPDRIRIQFTDNTMSTNVKKAGNDGGSTDRGSRSKNSDGSAW